MSKILDALKVVEEKKERERLARVANLKEECEKSYLLTEELLTAKGVLDGIHYSQQGSGSRLWLEGKVAGGDVSFLHLTGGTVEISHSCPNTGDSDSRTLYSDSDDWVDAVIEFLVKFIH